MSHSALEIHKPKHQTLPVIVTSPHSGQFYPEELLQQSQLGLMELRRLEDCYVDELWRFVIDDGAPMLSVRHARAFIDVNREALELDPTMFRAPLPVRANIDSGRLRAGLGAIPKVAGASQEIYADKINFIDALKRIDLVHRPFHTALSDLIQSTKRQFGYCLLIDCHSMPDQAAPRPFGSAHSIDIILGDRFGRSCNSRLMPLLEQSFRSAGFTTLRNDPYAGGYITQAYGKPDQQCDAVQIEINRRLYMDENNFSKTADFAMTAQRLRRAWQEILDHISIPQADETLLAAE